MALLAYCKIPSKGRVKDGVNKNVKEKTGGRKIKYKNGGGGGGGWCV